MKSLSTRLFRVGRRFGRLGAASLAIVTLAPALWAAPAVSGLTVDPGVFKGTADDCEKLGAGVDAGPDQSPGDIKLQKGLCLYNLVRDTNDREGLLRSVGLLEEAQTMGLDKNQMATAVLLEGLASCRVARAEMRTATADTGTSDDGSENKLDTAQTSLFCASRKAALASFAKVRMNNLDVTFPDGSGLSTDTLVDAMTACYAVDSPLNTRWASGCGIFSMDRENLTHAVDMAHQKIVSELTGSGGQLTAMFQRKQQIAKTASDNAVAKVDGLKTENQKVDDAYGTLNTAYTMVDAKLGSILFKYQRARNSAVAATQVYQSWKNGLFVAPDGTDHSYPLVTNPIAATMFDNINTKRASLNAPSTGWIATATDAVNALKAKPTAEANMKAEARKLCRVYYCETAVKDQATPSFKKVCDFKKNPLCPQWNTKLEGSGGQFTAEDFCRNADFPVQFMKVNMTPAESTQCWAGAQ